MSEPKELRERLEVAGLERDPLMLASELFVTVDTAGRIALEWHREQVEANYVPLDQAKAIAEQRDKYRDDCEWWVTVNDCHAKAEMKWAAEREALLRERDEAREQLDTLAAKVVRLLGRSYSSQGDFAFVAKPLYEEALVIVSASGSGGSTTEQSSE